MHEVILEFARRHAALFKGEVLDVGAYNVNGTLRSALPITWGVDMTPGPDVDQVVNVGDLVATFGPERFDGVASADSLEHMEDWRGAMQNMWSVVKSGGPLLLTVANPDKGFHGYPHDYWRWPLDRFRKLFGGNEIIGDFYAYPSMGVCVVKRGPLDLTWLPDRVSVPVRQGSSLRATDQARAFSVKVEEAWIRRFESIGALSAADTVLEVGCGLGGMAAAIGARFAWGSRYVGVDFSSSNVEAARSSITLAHPSFDFETFADGCLGIPVPAGSVDFAFAAGTFTHVLEDDLRRLLQQVFRALVPGGRLFATFFVLPDDYDSAPALPGARFRLTHRLSPNVRVLYPDRPEKVVGYEQGFLTDLMREIGFELPALVTGGWRGVGGAVSSHDIVLARKPSPV